MIANNEQIMRVIGRQVPIPRKQWIPEVTLFLAIIHNGLSEANATRDTHVRRFARNWFLSGDFEVYAELIGVEPGVILRILREAGCVWAYKKEAFLLTEFMNGSSQKSA